MKANLKILLLGLTALLIFAIYAFVDFKIGSGDNEVRKADFQGLYTLADNDSIMSVETVETPDSSIQKNEKEPIVFTPDSARNILFFGDSMLEGLCRRFIDYADQNGHDLHTVLWYSSSTEIWAKTDTLQYYINKFKPDYIVVCLGSNELFVKDIDHRKENIKKIVKKFGDLPFVWVSPPNWKKDTGINDAIISVVGKDRYFDSRSLKLERGPDHAHPTFPAAAIWMDTIARWLNSPACRNPIMMEWPQKEVPSRNVTMLQPYNR